MLNLKSSAVTLTIKLCALALCMTCRHINVNKCAKVLQNPSLEIAWTGQLS